MTVKTALPLYRRWAVWLLAILWSIEGLCVQEIATAPELALNPSDAIKYGLRRFVLNLLVSLAVVFLVPRRLLPFAFSLALFHASLLISFSQYFGKPLSWMVVQNQWSEAFTVADHAWTLVSVPAVLALAVALLVKAYLALRLLPTDQGATHRCRAGTLAACGAMGYAIWYAGIYKPVEDLKFTSPEYTYGSTLAWAAEAILFDDAKALETALEVAQQTSDVLREYGDAPPLGDCVVVVQVESLDWEAVEATVDGRPVMPFLRSLAKQSMYYPVTPIHDTGSADADFTLLTGVRANGRITPYKVAGFPYRRTLPMIASEQGYACYSLHGVTGDFFARRRPFESMGFDGCYFAEEMKSRGVPFNCRIVDDAKVFDLSLDLLQQTDGPVLHFIITMTSHGPFDHVPPGQRQLFPSQATEAEAYLNSMAYVDKCLSEYVAHLPDRAVLMLYGDHTSTVEGYAGSSSGKVPWLIYRKGESLAARQHSGQAVARGDVEVGHLDVVTMVHRSFARSESLQPRVAEGNSPAKEPPPAGLH